MWRFAHWKFAKREVAILPLAGLAEHASNAKFVSMNPHCATNRAQNAGIPWQAKLTIAVVCTALLTGGFLYGLVRSYLHSDAFRRLLSEKASKAIGTQGEFGPFRWDGLALESSSFNAQGTGPLRSLQMDGLRTEIGLGGLKNGVWEITGSKVHRLESNLDFNQVPIGPKVAKPQAPRKTPTPAPSKSWLPREVKFDGLQIADATINAKIGEHQIVVNQLSVDLQPSGRQGQAADIGGGNLTIVGKNYPPTHIDRIRLKHQDNRIYINQLELSAWDHAHLEASGEIDRNSGRHSIDGSISGIKCADALSGDWVKRLSGEIESTFTCHNHSGTTIASGKLWLKNGTLTALPALDALATFSDTQRFRSLAFNDARSDWQWQDGRLTLDKLVLASDGAIRAEGKINIDGQNLDGQLNIGLPAEIIAKLPSAASDVFTIKERGMHWAQVRISGTTDKPKEDLSGRLVGAAAARLIGKLQQGVPAAGENATGTVEEIISAEKPLEKGAEAILNNSESAGKLLRGLLQSIPAKE